MLIEFRRRCANISTESLWFLEMKKTNIFILVLLGIVICSCGGFLIYRLILGPVSSSVEFIEEHFEEEIEFASRCAFDNDFYNKRDYKELQKLYSKKGILLSKFSLQPNNFTIITGDYSYQKRSIFLPRTASQADAVSQKCYDIRDDGTELTVIEYTKIIEDGFGQKAMITLLFDFDSLQRLNAETRLANPVEQSGNKPAQ